MKYLWFLSGLLLFIAGIEIALHGILDHFDATVSAAPMCIGGALMAAGAIQHSYDNWRDR